MTYVMFPVQGQTVIDGPCVAAGYSAASQEEARQRCLALNPQATGTARCWAGRAGEIVTGDIAGHDLDGARPR